MTRARLHRVAALSAALLVFSSATARAGLDVSRAEADAKEAVAQNRAFCTHPKKPLSPEERRFCAVASELPECAAFAAACTEDAKEAEEMMKRAEKDGAHDGSQSAARHIPEVLGQLAQVVVWMLLAFAVLAILVPVVQAILRRRRDQALADATPAEATSEEARAPLAVELPPDDAETLLRRAEELARGGRYDAALFTYLFAALRALDGRGAIRIAKHRTHGEYIRFCKDPAAREPLREIVLDVELVRFGGRAATPDAVGRAAERATWLVRTGLPIVTALFVLFVAGCGYTPERRSGVDPAGTEIFTALLRKQGLKVEPLETSLGSLPIPSEDEIAATPAVVIDLSRTKLEPEAESHLEEWVEAGGMLVLAGDPAFWPVRTRATWTTSKSTEIHAFVPEERKLTEDDDDTPIPFRPGVLVSPSAFRWTEEDVVVLAATEDGALYAAARPVGRGSVLAMASNDLLTNAGLARAHNPTALVAILASLGRTELRIARPEDGISPPSNPIAGITRAGLALPLWHGIIASLILFAAVGVRLARPKPTAPPKRRAFAEHVRATGAFYARVSAARHALAVFARYARERLRGAGSAGGARTFARSAGARGAVDPVTVLAQRTGRSPEACAAVWGRASEAVFADQEGGASAPRGDELATLKELSALLTEATKAK